MTVEYVGPFESWAVVVEGRRVPLLDAVPQPGGKISLSLDGRYGLDLPLAEAERIVPFIANAIAIAAGYACHASADQNLVPLGPLAPRRLMELGAARVDEPTS